MQCVCVGGFACEYRCIDLHVCTLFMSLDRRLCVYKCYYMMIYSTAFHFPQTLPTPSSIVLSVIGVCDPNVLIPYYCVCVCLYDF